MHKKFTDLQLVMKTFESNVVEKCVEKTESDPEYKKSISNHQMFREIEGTFINYEK